MFDFMQGPIWLSDIDSGCPMTGITSVDKDPLLRKLNRECAELFQSFYKFDEDGNFSHFDEVQEFHNKERLLSYITRIKNRLASLNNGDFIVEDRETERLLSLKNPQSSKQHYDFKEE